MPNTLALVLIGGLLGGAVGCLWESLDRIAARHLLWGGWHVHHSIVGLALMIMGGWLKIQQTAIWDIFAFSVGGGLVIAYAGFNGWRLPIITRDYRPSR